MSKPRAEMRVERLPFTVYDVIGYLVPGTFALWIGFVFAKKLNSNATIDANTLNIVGSSSESIYFSLFIFIIAAYAVGHLVGLMSSITVEKIAVEYFGYPSKFLTILGEEKLSNEDKCRAIIAENMVSSGFHRKRVFLAKIFCWPIWISVRLLISTGLFTIFMKPLSAHISAKLKSRLEILHLDAGPFERCGWWKSAEFHVINNIPNAFSRMYNYLTIFGFFRNFSFIFIVISSMYLIKFSSAFWPSFNFISSLSGETLGLSHFEWEISANLNWNLLIASIVSSGIAALFFLGFLKFYRRYSEEAILALCYFDGDAKNQNESEKDVGA